MAAKHAIMRRQQHMQAGNQFQAMSNRLTSFKPATPTRGVPSLERSMPRGFKSTLELSSNSEPQSNMSELDHSLAPSSNSNQHDLSQRLKKTIFDLIPRHRIKTPAEFPGRFLLKFTNIPVDDPRWRDISAFTANSNESEVLCLPNATFRVVSREKGTNQVRVDGEMVNQEIIALEPIDPS